MRKPMKEFSSIFHLSFLFFMLKTINTLDMITSNQSISGNQTLVSSGGTYEFGLFSPGDSKSWYLGIWYKKIPVRTFVWVANREDPILDSSGALIITGNNILLQNSTEHIVWSGNTSRTAQNPILQLLESGNLVLKDGDDHSDNNNDNEEFFLWQSFDYPCDTFLPGMKLGVNFKTGLNRTLSAWKGTDNPAQGQCMLEIDTHGFPQTVYRRGPTILFRAGPWNGQTFTGLPAIKSNQEITLDFEFNDNEVYFKYELRKGSAISRYALSSSGLAQWFRWVDESQSWELFNMPKVDNCDNYGYCGVFSSCNTNEPSVCSCFEGFTPRSQTEWSSGNWSGGCVRKTPLNCSVAAGFQKFTKVKLPDTSSSWFDKTLSLKQCEKICSDNCNCAAYANIDIRNGGSGCLMWFGDLIDIRILQDSEQEIYIKMAASALDGIENAKQTNKKKQVIIIVVSLLTGMGLLILGYVVCIWMRKHRMKGISKEDMDLPIFDYKTIANATRDFAEGNKLGEGGFGPVYKGTLSEGQDIAVKRLSKDSGQGQKEFMNEVKLIAKLQHRNLVKLLGCCIEKEENMLVYEYMSNKSLNFFIFDQTKRQLLDWHKRIDIIVGIARGLLYLHHDSRLRIIHRDLKASNVLLDCDLNPKISDFGIARIFGGDQVARKTKRVVGTYGYMSPEYAVDGFFSVKSDVFSFGVLALEILCGKKNRGFSHPEHSLNLLGHAWKLFIQGKPWELIEDDDSRSMTEVLRCIHVALLCVQKTSDDRPTMSSVVVMLCSESPLPQPKQPGFFLERDPSEADTSQSNQHSCSLNEITMTSLDAR